MKEREQITEELVSLVSLDPSGDFIIRVKKPTPAQAQALSKEATRRTKEKGSVCGSGDTRSFFHSDGTTIDTVAHAFEHLSSAEFGAEMALMFSREGSLNSDQGTFLISLDLLLTKEQVMAFIDMFNRFASQVS